MNELKFKILMVLNHMNIKNYPKGECSRKQSIRSSQKPSLYMYLKRLLKLVLLVQMGP